MSITLLDWRSGGQEKKGGVKMELIRIETDLLTEIVRANDGDDDEDRFGV